MEAMETIFDGKHLTKEQIVEKYEWQINNLVNPQTHLFETTTDLAARLGKHPVEFNRMLRDIGILEAIYRVGKRGTKDIDIIGWKITEEHRRYLLSNALAIEVKETRDAVYWNQTKITHILMYINIYLKKSFMPQLKIK